MAYYLYDIHQDRNQRFRWHGANPGSDLLIVSRRSYHSRGDAEHALKRFLDLLRRCGLI